MKIRRGITTITVLLALTGLLAGRATADDGTVFYLSVGTSLSVGTQPNLAGKNRRTQDGYASQLHAALAEESPKLRLVRLGCWGETTVTMIDGGICDYEQGSQLAQAVKFLEDHQGSVALVTIDMGANDIEPCGSLGGIDLECVAQALADVSANLPVILGALRAAAGPGVLIVGMNYYNPFLAAWFVDQSLAEASAGFLALFNGLLGGFYTAFGVPVADVAAAFASGDFTPGPGGVPINVLLICQWTWMCAAPPVGPNIHANVDGYRTVAAAFLGAM
jgi:lysophospholipase L1-like esterase